MTTHYTQAKPGLRTRAKRVVYIGVLIMVIVLATAASVYVLFGPDTPMSPSCPCRPALSYLYLSIFYENNFTATTGYFGSVNRSLNNGLPFATPFTTSFTLYLKPTETSHSVDQINIVFTPSYWVRTASPSPPFTIAPGTSKTITVTVPFIPAIPYVNATINLYTH